MRIILLVAGILLVAIGHAQNPLILKYSKTITAQELEKHLKIIASDQFEGRGTGEKGHEMASKYIANEFKAEKLLGPVKDSENPYFQEIELEKKYWTKITLSAGKESFENYRTVAFLETGEGVKDFDVVFAGYGYYSDNYSDYTFIDVKDKIVAFMIGEPKNKSGIYLTTGKTEPSFTMDTTINSKFESVQAKAMAAMIRGAKGFILIEENDIEAAKTIKLLQKYLGGTQLSFPGNKAAAESFPVLYMSPTEAARLFGTTKKKFDKLLADSISKGVSPAGKYTQKIKIEANRKTELVKSGNVIGLIEGTDKKEETLVICGHYDHEGIINGEIYNGADDNGTGTVALLELAQAFSIAKADGNNPRRSILFIALTGEEKGLLGSKYYARNPVSPMNNTVTALNMDMLGRIDNEHMKDSNYIYCIGSDYMSSELHKINEESAKIYTPELKIDYTFNDKNHPEKLYYRSDQISFAEKGVPVIFYFSGMHPEYHTPDDDVDKIDFKMFEKRLHLIFATAWELANRDERVKVDKK